MHIILGLPLVAVALFGWFRGWLVVALMNTALIVIAFPILADEPHNGPRAAVVCVTALVITWAPRWMRRTATLRPVIVGRRLTVRSRFQD